ncbi:MAG: cell division protein FtsX [Acidimicrobiia bacterium]
MALKIDYALKETAANLRRNLTLTMATLLTVAVSLALAGSSILMRQAVDNATRQWRGGVEFIVWLNADATQDQIDAVGRDLNDNPEVKAPVRYVGKSEAFKEVQDLYRNDPGLIGILTEADMPTSYRVVPKTADSKVIQSIGDVFTKKPGVWKVDYAKKVVDELKRSTTRLRTLILVAALVSLFAALLLILNTIRTAMFARRREIEVMKLVGATNWFIRIPFMLEGLVQGLIGGAAAYLSVWAGASWWVSSVRTGDVGSFFAALSVTGGQIRTVGLLLMLLGIFVGTVGSGIAVSRFLDV